MVRYKRKRSSSRGGRRVRRRTFNRKKTTRVSAVKKLSRKLNNMIEWKHIDFELFAGYINTIQNVVRLGEITQGAADDERNGDKIWMSTQTICWNIGQADVNQTCNMLLLRCPGNVGTPPALTDIYSNFDAAQPLKLLFYNLDNFRAYKWKVKWVYSRTVAQSYPGINKELIGRKKLSLKHSVQYINGSTVQGSPYFLYFWSDSAPLSSSPYLTLNSRIIYNDL